MRIHSDPKRAADPHALPDVEVFYAKRGEFEHEATDEPSPAGWYWWTCLPGCLPDSPPFGPFETKEAAIADACEQHEQYESD